MNHCNRGFYTERAESIIVETLEVLTPDLNHCVTVLRTMDGFDSRNLDRFVIDELQVICAGVGKVTDNGYSKGCGIGLSSWNRWSILTLDAKRLSLDMRSFFFIMLSWSAWAGNVRSTNNIFSKSTFGFGVFNLEHSKWATSDNNSGLTSSWS